jgi:hypothetical protein
MAKKLRDTATAFCECEGIIHLPQSCLALETYWFGRKFSPSINSNNPLAAEHENENDAAPENSSIGPLSRLRWQAAAQATTSGIS